MWDRLYVVIETGQHWDSDAGTEGTGDEVLHGVLLPAVHAGGPNFNNCNINITHLAEVPHT